MKYFDYVWQEIKFGLGWFFEYSNRLSQLEEFWKRLFKIISV